MFRAANTLARKFTFPVIMLRKSAAGKCSGGIGSFVVVNNEGWIVTCRHVLKMVQDLVSQEQNARSIESQNAAINADTSLSGSERKRRLAAIPRLAQTDTDRAAILWAVNLPSQPGLEIAHWIDAIDLAVCKLNKFDPGWVASYPEFKDPSKNFEPGATLCKLGYPIHNIVPEWIEATKTFNLPAGSLPVPLFPIDGILTRFVNFQFDQQHQICQNSRLRHRRLD
jgi:hypothetical protein